MSDATVKIEDMKAKAADVAELLKIMAHPDRLMVVCQLTAGEMGVSQLQQNSTLTQSAFSQHLTVLRKHGIIVARKESQQVFYSLGDVRVSQLIRNLQDLFCN